MRQTYTKKNKALEPVVKFLLSAWYWEKRANRLIDDIKRLRSRAEKTTTAYSLTPPASSFSDSRQSNIERMVDKQREYEDARRECEKRLEEIRFFIGLLDSYVERTVCEYRYLSYYEWLDIGLALNYSPSALEKIHNKALENLLKVNSEIIAKSGKGFF